MERFRSKPQKGVLSFEQSGESLRGRAHHRLSKGDLWGALGYLRRAQEKDDAGAVRMDIAEVLAQMGLYELSSEILLGVLVEGDEAHTPECYFALGCNFMALGFNELSHDALLHYYTSYPDGEFIEDCADMLDSLEDILETAEPPAMAAIIAADEGKNDLDEGRYLEAVQKLEQAVQADGRMLYARNNLALAYYCVQEYDKAVKAANEVLKVDGRNVHALCNLALILHAKGEQDEAVDMVTCAMMSEDMDDEEQFKVCVTLAELGMDEKALEHAGAILRYSPFVPPVLFVRAVALYNLHRPLEAYRTFARLLLLDPENAVYRHLHGRAARDSEKTQVQSRMDYVPALPMEQIVKRVSLLQSWMSKPVDKRLANWRTNEHLRDLARWGFTLGEQSFKQNLASAIAELDDPDAMALLKRLLMSLEQSDELKKHIVLALTHSGITGPYQALIGDSIAQVNIRFAGVGNRKMPVAYERVLKRALDELDDHGKEVQQNSIRLWLAYILSTPENTALPPVKGENAWVAALVFCAHHVSGRALPVKEAAKMLRTRADAVEKRVDILLQLYAEFPEEGY